MSTERKTKGNTTFISSEKMWIVTKAGQKKNIWCIVVKIRKQFQLVTYLQKVFALSELLPMMEYLSLIIVALGWRMGVGSTCTAAKHWIRVCIAVPSQAAIYLFSYSLIMIAEASSFSQTQKHFLSIINASLHKYTYYFLSFEGFAPEKRLII